MTEKPPIDHVAIRRRAAETYDVSIGMAAQHLAASETSLLHDDQQAHLRFAEVYALLARACQKIPGSQF